MIQHHMGVLEVLVFSLLLPLVELALWLTAWGAIIKDVLV